MAKSSITARIKLGSRSGTIKLVGGRNSAGGRSDIKAIDAGRVRAPSWGRRGVGSWHSQTVRPGFFTETAASAKDWHDDVERAVDDATRSLRE